MTDRPRRTGSAVCLALAMLVVACGSDAALPAPSSSSAPSRTPAASGSLDPSPSTPATATIQPTATPPLPDIASLSDAFDTSATLDEWQRLNVAEAGFPDTLKTVDVDETSPGALFMEPWTTAWYGDFRGPLLFKEVAGDFVVTARVRASGHDDEVPQRTYSLVGLAARTPRAITVETWVPGGEDYVFINVGAGDQPGRYQLETKTTVKSRSTLTLKSVPIGWVEVRIVRVGNAMLMLFRPDGATWQLSSVFDRDDMPPNLQVGTMVYTDWEGMVDFHADPAAYNRLVLKDRHPDLLASVDFIRFARPEVPPALLGRDLANPLEATADELVSAFGGDR